MRENDKPFLCIQLLIQKHKAVITINIDEAAGMVDHVLQAKCLYHSRYIWIIHCRIEINDRESLLPEGILQRLS